MLVSNQVGGSFLAFHQLRHSDFLNSYNNFQNSVNIIFSFFLLLLPSNIYNSAKILYDAPSPLILNIQEIQYFSNFSQMLFQTLRNLQRFESYTENLQINICFNKLRNAQQRMQRARLPEFNTTFICSNGVIFGLDGGANTRAVLLKKVECPF